MNKFAMALLSASALLSLADMANAADLRRAPAPVYVPPPPVALPVVLNWTGGYIGIQAGYADDDADFSATGETVPFGTLNLRGGFGGGRLGYDFQAGNFVLGILGDINGG